MPSDAAPTTRPDKERWHQFLLSHDVNPWVAGIWSARARKCARIELNNILMPRPPVGSSRFGGMPDLVSEDDWPVRNGHRLSLLAQIDLAEIADLPTGLDLPAAGLLQFFFDLDDPAWIFADELDMGGFRVRYVQDGSPLVAMKSEPAVAPMAYGLKFTPSECLPDWWWMHDWLQRETSFTEDQIDDFRFEFDDETWDATENDGNLLGGWPATIQHPMELECELASKGIPPGKREYVSEWTASGASRAEDWRLLLQLDSMERELGWMWGDVGKLYFWCRQQDIAERRFDRAWVILQCT